MATTNKLFLILSLLLSLPVCGQQGKYLYLWGGPQYVSIANYDDYTTYDEKRVQDDTYRAGFGLDYAYNFSPSVGFQTGLAYSRQGQKYSGKVKDYYYSLDSIKYSNL